jgi:alkyl sulfatase BDS1-like metallo-beta-lactamase superfamily hydrolase
MQRAPNQLPFFHVFRVTFSENPPPTHSPSADVLKAQPLRNVFQKFSVNVDPRKCADLHRTLVFRITDRDDAYALELRRGVLQIHQGVPAFTDLQLALETATLYSMLRDFATQLSAALQNGAVVLEHGTQAQVSASFDCFDTPSRRMPVLAAR